MLLKWLQEALEQSVVAAKDVPDSLSVFQHSERTELIDCILCATTLNLLNPTLASRLPATPCTSKYMLVCGPHASLEYQERLIRSVEGCAEDSVLQIACPNLYGCSLFVEHFPMSILLKKRLAF